MSASTAKYKNAPIIEALCELQFDLPDKPGSHFMVMVGKMQEAMAGDYPGKPNEQRLRQVTVPMDTGVIATEDTLFRIHIPASDGKRLLTIGPQSLAVNILTPYLSWEDDFRPRVLSALDTYWKKAEPIAVKRIGVRYINRINLPETPSDYKKWIDSPALTPTYKETILDHFTMRSESVRHDKTKIIVTLMTLPERDPHPHVLLDIDVVWDAAPIDDQKAVIARIEELHTLEGRVFESLLQQPARDLFNA